MGKGKSGVEYRNKQKPHKYPEKRRARTTQAGNKTEADRKKLEQAEVKKKKNKGWQTKWQDIFLFRIYDMKREGYTQAQMAEALGVGLPTLTRWLKEKPALVALWKDARSVGKDRLKQAEPERFFEYVYRHLPDHLQEVWDEVIWLNKTGGTLAQLEALMEQAGERGRQHMFFHALVNCNFNASEACRLVNISRKTLNSWIESEPDFNDLMEEILWHKKNFFEGHLMRLVERGDPSAILFANKTMNKDRGYQDKQEIEVTHGGKVEHQVNVDALPVDLRAKLLEELNKQERKQESVAATVPKGHLPLIEDPDIIDAEYVPLSKKMKQENEE